MFSSALPGVFMADVYPPLLIASKHELDHADVYMAATYRFARMFGLSPDQKAFIFKIVQTLLPTRERLVRLGKVWSQAFTFCDDQEVDNVGHFLSSGQSTEVGSRKSILPYDGYGLLIHCFPLLSTTLTLQLVSLPTSPSPLTPQSPQ